MSKCKICRSEFKKISITHKTCSPDCAIELVKRDKEKKAARSERFAARELKKRKIDTRTRAEWLRLVQADFNAYIRKRDEPLPCISCGRHHKGQYHAGHYLSIGARSELRFDESNCHKQCQPCNSHLSGNITLYRINLVKKIGQEEVDRLESSNTPKKWQIDELIELRKLYKQKLRDLQSPK